MLDLEFYRGKRVFVTGHTGFKGAWLCRVLIRAGASVFGYSLEPPTNPSLYELSGIEGQMTSYIGDIRDLAYLKECFDRARPEIVFHLAAQPIVREGYKAPRETYETNVMGAVNILECIRLSDTVRSFLNVTTDKVYKNNEDGRGHCEDDELCGYDPYSNSKSCSELVTYSYKSSFFADGHVAISTARAGNSIGGGDFAADRIIPNCVKAVTEDQTIAVRNPHSVRPYQHVLEAIFAYLMIAALQYENSENSGNYNIGPERCDCLETGALVDIFCKYWGEGARWVRCPDSGPRETKLLMLDCKRLKSTFSWSPVWTSDDAIKYTVEWFHTYLNGEDIVLCQEKQIDAFTSACAWLKK